MEEKKSRYKYAIGILNLGHESSGYCEDYEILYNDDNEPVMVAFFVVTFGDENSEPEYEVYNADYSDVKWIRKNRKT